MPNIKVTYIYELTTLEKGNTVTGAREAGWTETFIGSYAGVNDPTIVADVGQVLSARLAILATQGRFTGFRAHDLSSNATRAYPYNFSVAGTAGDCTLPHVALLTRFFAANQQNNRPLEMRGLPAAAVVTGELNPGFFGGGVLNRFGSLVCQKYGMLGVNKSFPKFKVDSVSTGGVVKLKENGVGFAANQTVKFYRTKIDGTCCGGVGTYTVGAFDGLKTLTLTGWPTDQSAFGGSVAQWTPPAFLTFDTSSTAKGIPNGFGWERVVVRKTGRPFDLFSGRRSKTCCKC